MTEAENLLKNLKNYKKGLITKVSIISTDGYLGVFQLKDNNNIELEKVENLDFLKSRLSNYEFKWGSTHNKKNPFYHSFFYESKIQEVSSEWFFDLAERFLDEYVSDDNIENPLPDYCFGEFLEEYDVILTSEGIFGEVELLGEGKEYLGYSKLTNNIEYAVADELEESDYEFLFE
tara:strand:- start:360 stop:887 length:528 start_codon:yes stop_codon:yes gene_type:complete